MLKSTTRTRRTSLVAIVVRLLVTSITLANARQSHYYSSHVAFVFRRIPPLEGELGSSPTLSRVLGRDKYYFDPFELASDENFARFRESELIKHGRVAMVATIGMLAPSIVLGDDKWTALNVVKSMTWVQYAQILLTCAFLEAFVFVQQDSRDMPGDYAIGYFGIRDKGLNERSMISELENGRLAMLAFVVQLILEIVTKKSIVGQWEDVLAAIANAKK